MPTSIADQLPFPTLDQLPQADIGAAIWSSLPGEVGATPRQFLWIEHVDGEWFAGFEEDGECRLACVWDDDPVRHGTPGAIRQVGGGLAPHLNASLTNEQRTSRIWDFFIANSLGMIAQTYIPGAELEMASRVGGSTSLGHAAEVTEILTELRRQRGLILSNSKLQP